MQSFQYIVEVFKHVWKFEFGPLFKGSSYFGKYCGICHDLVGAMK